jgi:glycosyltransferase involved in cell wall biosynthesis
VRVGIVTDGLFPHVVGGIQRYTARLAPELVGLGVDVEVIAPIGNESPGLPYRVLPLSWPGGAVYPLALRRWAAACARTVSEREYDVVLGQGLNLWGMLPEGAPPELFHPHGLEMCTVRGVAGRAKAWPLRYAARQEASQAAAVVSLGGKLGAVLESSLHVPRERIVTIPNGVDTLEFVPGGSAEPATILWVGRFFSNKAPDRMLDIFDRLMTPGVRLVLVGDGPMRRELETVTRPNVTFAGAISDAELHQLYRSASLVAVPSRDDGMPTVILEAFASGCPAVAFDVGAVAELVDESTGALVSANDLAGMALAIDDLLGDSGRRAAAGRAARARVEREFSWPAVATRTLAALEWVRR